MNLPPTALRETDLKVGQRIVYPNQGVCTISGLETKEIGGVRAEFLSLRREDGASVLVPRAKLATIGLRRVAQPDEVKTIFKFLEAEGSDPELDWKVRHRTHTEKMTDGSLTGTTEVLKALHSLAERRPLPQKERELYDSARHLLVNEVAVALAVSPATAEDTIDFCLTPPAGSGRAQQKAKLKADREAAAEAVLLEGLEDLGDLSDVLPAGTAALEGTEEELSESASDEAHGEKPSKAKSAGPPAAKRAGKVKTPAGAKPAAKGKAAKPTKAAKPAPKRKAAAQVPRPKAPGKVASKPAPKSAGKGKR